MYPLDEGLSAQPCQRALRGDSGRVAMAKRKQTSASTSLFDSLVQNAIDFLRQSASDLKQRPKYSVIHFC